MKYKLLFLLLFIFLATSVCAIQQSIGGYDVHSKVMSGGASVSLAGFNSSFGAGQNIVSEQVVGNNRLQLGLFYISGWNVSLDTNPPELSIVVNEVSTTLPFVDVQIDWVSTDYSNITASIFNVTLNGEVFFESFSANGSVNLSNTTSAGEYIVSLYGVDSIGNSDLVTDSFVIVSEVVSGAGGVYRPKINFTRLNVSAVPVTDFEKFMEFVLLDDVLLPKSFNSVSKQVVFDSSVVRVKHVLFVVLLFLLVFVGFVLLKNNDRKNKGGVV